MLKDKKKYFSGLTRDSYYLTFVSLFADISTEMLYPILPIYLTQYLKTGGSIVGLIEGVATATQNIVQGISGVVSDKLQNRKLLALSGYLLSAFSKPAIGFSTIWQSVFSARFFDRLGTGIRSAPRDALISASVDEKNQGKAFGIEGFGDNLGAFLGPIVCVCLIYLFKVEIRNIFLLAIVPGLLSVIMLSKVRENTSKTKSKSKLDLSFKSFSQQYWKYMLATAIFGLGNSANSFLILQIKSVGVPLIFTILIYAVFNLVAAIISYPLGSLSDKFGRKQILLTSFVIFIVVYSGFGLTSNLLILGGLFILYGIYQGIFRSVGKAYVIDLVPANLKASGIGWYSANIGITGLIASIVAGQIWDHNHFSVFLYGAAFATLGTGIFLVLNPRKNSNL